MPSTQIKRTPLFLLLFFCGHPGYTRYLGDLRDLQTSEFAITRRTPANRTIIYLYASWVLRHGLTGAFNKKTAKFEGVAQPRGTRGCVLTRGEEVKFLAGAVLFCLFFLAAIPGCSSGCRRSGKPLLPVSGFTPGWALEGPVKTYTPDDLFEYINGEAELYLQYGFKDLVSGFYLKDKDEKQGVSADIYRMASPLEAFGLYTPVPGDGGQNRSGRLRGFCQPFPVDVLPGALFRPVERLGDGQTGCRGFYGLGPGDIRTFLPTALKQSGSWNGLKSTALYPGSEKYLPDRRAGLSYF